MKENDTEFMKRMRVKMFEPVDTSPGSFLRFITCGWFEHRRYMKLVKKEGEEVQKQLDEIDKRAAEIKNRRKELNVVMEAKKNGDENHMILSDQYYEKYY